MPDKALLVSIAGRVQGVGYRMWTERQAQALGLRGWVRNESADGSVTALLGGPADAVAKTLSSCSGTGPRGAAVTGVTGKPADAADLPSGFREVR